VKKLAKITVWILILLFFGVSGIAFYVFHSAIWKRTAVNVLKNQLSARSDLVLNIGELSGNPFGNVKFSDIRLTTPRGYDIATVAEVNLQYGLMYFEIQGVQISYPAAFDSLSAYLKGSKGGGIKSRLAFNKFELIDFNIANSKKLDESLFASDYMQGRILFSPDSTSIYVEEGNLDLCSMNERLQLENTQLTFLPDSLIIQSCSMLNRSTTIEICGAVSLDSIIHLNLDYNIANLVFNERIKGQRKIFSDRDFLNLQGSLDLFGRELTLKSSFDGQFLDNRVSNGALSGVYQNGAFNFDQISFESGAQIVSGSLSGDLMNGAVAVIDVGDVDLQTWRVLRSNTAINGRLRLESLGRFMNPDTLFADLALKNLLIDTLQIDSINGGLRFSNGLLQIVDTINVEFAKTRIRIDGLCNLDSNTVSARAYFSSDSINILSELVPVSNLRGRLEGFLESSGRLNSPDFRGWLRGWHGQSVFRGSDCPFRTDEYSGKPFWRYLY